MIVYSDILSPNFEIMFKDQKVTIDGFISFDENGEPQFELVGFTIGNQYFDNTDSNPFLKFLFKQLSSKFSDDPGVKEFFLRAAGINEETFVH